MYINEEDKEALISLIIDYERVLEENEKLKAECEENRKRMQEIVDAQLSGGATKGLVDALLSGYISISVNVKKNKIKLI